MKRSNYDGNGVFHFKNGGLEEIMNFFAKVEATTSVLERIEVNAMSFMHFRRLGTIVEQPTLREVKKGLFGRIYTSEIWLNNSLKDGQLRVFWNKILSSEDSVKDEIKIAISVKPETVDAGL